MRVLKRFPSHCVYQIIPSPVGELVIIAGDAKLHGILWKSDLENEATRTCVSSMKRVTKDDLIDEVGKQLQEYFSGKRKQFDLPIEFNGTPFQQAVWKGLLEIPYGETASYQEQALALGDKNKVRAVGTANGANPISVVVPCHRVIGKNGSLTGYAGGLAAKQFLLQLEKAV